MSRAATILFWSYLLFVFLCGSLGLPELEQLETKALLGLPLVLAIIIEKNRPLEGLPRWFGYGLVTLGLLLLLGSGFSQNYGQLLSALSRWAAGLSLAVFGALYRQDISKQLPKIILGLGGFYALYSLLLQELPEFLLWLRPVSGYNLVFPTYHLHNHLGDFLVLSILCLLSSLKSPGQRVFKFAWLAIFSLLLLYSYSRSSYTALLVSVFVWLGQTLKNKPPRITLLSGALLIGGAAFFLALTTNELSWKLPFLNAWETKPLFNGRDQYWGASLESIKDHPWFGIGSGNFAAAMGRYGEIPMDWTESSLNLFLTLASENGLLVLATFLGGLFWGLRQFSGTLNLGLFLALLVNFQTDYTYRIGPMWLLFWLLLGLGVKRTPGKLKLPSHLPLWGGLIGVWIILLLTFSNFWQRQGNYWLAWATSPFDQQNNERLLSHYLLTGEFTKAAAHLRIYQKFYRSDSAAQYAAANYWLGLGEREAALAGYYQAYRFNPYTNLDLYRQINRLERELNGERSAKEFLANYSQKVQKLKDQSYFSQIIRRDWQKFRKTDQK